MSEAAAVSCLACLSHNEQYTYIHISPTSYETGSAAASAAADVACNVPQVALLNKPALAEG